VVCAAHGKAAKQTVATTAQTAALKGLGFSRAARRTDEFVGFTGCGKTHSEWHEVSGHGFSRAVSAAKSTVPSGPEGSFLGVRVKSRPFFAACKAAFHLVRFMARLKPCPFKKQISSAT
jgi:hypothetical protein